MEMLVQFPLWQDEGSNKVIVSMGENKPLGTVGIYIAPENEETPSAWQRYPQRPDKDDLCLCPGSCICVPRTHVCLFLEEGCLSLSVLACRLGPILLDLLQKRERQGALSLLLPLWTVQLFLCLLAQAAES